MNFLKTITIITLTIFLSHFATAEKRASPRYTMEDLTNPKSPSYVPYPYPETDAEIVSNLKYILNKQYSRETWSYSLTTYIDLLPELIKKNSDVEVSEIVKVKNRISLRAHDYTYLITITDKKRNLNARVAMLAYGLLSGGADPSPTKNIKKIKNKERTEKVLKEKFGISFKEKSIVEFEVVAHSYFGFSSIVDPLYRFKLSDGNVYYMDDRDRLYTISDKKPVPEKSKRGTIYQQARREFFRKGEVVFDSLSDMILYFKEIKKLNE
jgi:hypothetical protein